MKTKWYITVLTGLMLCGTTHAQSVYEDDIYYNPSQKPVYHQKSSVSKTSTKKIYTTETPTVKSARDVDEYNRRESSEPEIYDDLAYAESSSNMDSLETGQPFEYSERIRRFHNNKFNTHITDGAYLNIYIEDAGYTDVNIYYIDGYSNAWMSPYYYDSYYYPRNGWGFNNWYRNRWDVYYDPWTFSSWGYYDPWFSVNYRNTFWYDPWWGYSGYRPLYPYMYDPYAYGYYQGYHDGYYDGYYGGNYSGYYGLRNSRRALSTSQRDFVSRVGSGLSSRNRTISGGRVMSSANSGNRINSGSNRSVSTTTRNVSTINSNRSGVESVSRSSAIDRNVNGTTQTQSRTTQPSIYTKTTRSTSVGTSNQPVRSSVTTPTRNQTTNSSVTTSTRSQTTNGSVAAPSQIQSSGSSVSTPTPTPTRSQTTTVVRQATSSQTSTGSSSTRTISSPSSSSSSSYSTPATTTTTTTTRSTTSTPSSSSGASRTTTISGGRR